MSLHNLYSPSGADIWSVCPKSGQLRQRLGLHSQDLTNAAASAGTHTHAWLEYLIKRYIIKVIDAQEPALCDNERVKTQAKKLAYTAYKHFYKQVYERYKTDNKFAVQVRCEQKLPYVVNDENVGGTVDLVITQRKTDGSGLNSKIKKLGIYDLKGGCAEIVAAYQNKQLMLYALAACHYFSYTLKQRLAADMVIELGILQPALSRYPVYTLDLFELKGLTSPIVNSLVKRQDKYYGGLHCKYCQVKNWCPEVRRSINKLEHLVRDRLEIV